MLSVYQSQWLQAWQKKWIHPSTIGWCKQTDTGHRQVKNCTKDGKEPRDHPFNQGYPSSPMIRHIGYIVVLASFRTSSSAWHDACTSWVLLPREAPRNTYTQVCRRNTRPLWRMPDDVNIHINTYIRWFLETSCLTKRMAMLRNFCRPDSCAVVVWGWAKFDWKMERIRFKFWAISVVFRPCWCQNKFYHNTNVSRPMVSSVAPAGAW